jgi:membrane protease YdiL (CAAX protease family)
MSQSTIADPASQRATVGLLSSLDRLPVVSLPVLAGLLLLRSVLLFTLIGVIRLVGPASWPDGLIMTNSLIMIVDAVTIGVVIMVLRRGGVGFGSLIGRFRPVDALWSLLVLVILFVGFLAASFAGNLIAYGGAPPVAGQLTVPLWVGLGALPAALTIGLAEESIYRGVAQDQLTRRFGRLPAWLMIWLRRLWPLVIGYAVIDLVFLSLPTLMVALS